MEQSSGLGNQPLPYGHTNGVVARDVVLGVVDVVGVVEVVDVVVAPASAAPKQQ